MYIYRDSSTKLQDEDGQCIGNKPVEIRLPKNDIECGEDMGNLSEVGEE